MPFFGKSKEDKYKDKYVVVWEAPDGELLGVTKPLSYEEAVRHHNLTLGTLAHENEYIIDYEQWLAIKASRDK